MRESTAGDGPSRFGFVSAEDLQRLTAAMEDFTRRAGLARSGARKGSPMAVLEQQKWQAFLPAIDDFLAAGVAPRESASMIRLRATLEGELEADAQVYAQIPPSLVDEVLERETRLGLRLARIARAAEAQNAPAPLTQALPSRGGYGWPVSPVQINSLFGRRFHPIAKRYKEHTGLDLAASTGQDVFSAKDGVVISAGWAGGYGNQVQVEHGGGIVTRYSHLSRLLVQQGQAVSLGQRVGLAGATGDATGPHLHFEVWSRGSAVDPLEVLGVPAEGRLGRGR